MEVLHWAGNLHHTIKGEKVRHGCCGIGFLIAWGLKPSIISRHLDEVKMLTKVRQAGKELTIVRGAANMPQLAEAYGIPLSDSLCHWFPSLNLIWGVYACTGQGTVARHEIVSYRDKALAHNGEGYCKDFSRELS